MYYIITGIHAIKTRFCDIKLELIQTAENSLRKTIAE